MPAIGSLLAVAVALFLYLNQGLKPTAEALGWYREGLKRYTEGRIIALTKALERAIKLSPEFALAHARLAEAWNELDSPQRSSDAMLRATGPGMKWRAIPIACFYRPCIRF